MTKRILLWFVALLLLAGAGVYAQSCFLPYDTQVVNKVTVAATSSVSCCVTLASPSVDTDYLVTIYAVGTSSANIIFRLRWNDGVGSQGYNAQLFDPSSYPAIVQSVHVAAGQTLSYYYDYGGSGTVYTYITVVKE